MQKGSIKNYIDDIFDSLSDPEGNSLELARQAIEKYPEDGLIVRLAAFAALKKNRGDIALGYINRIRKYFPGYDDMYFCEAIALAMSGKIGPAKNIFNNLGIKNLSEFNRKIIDQQFIPPVIFNELIDDWWLKIITWNPARKAPKKSRKKQRISEYNRKQKISTDNPGDSPKNGNLFPEKNENKVEQKFLLDPLKEIIQVEPLSKPELKIPISIHFPGKDDIFIATSENQDLNRFTIRNNFIHLSLLKGYDELLCISAINNVDHHYYQLETARKVLKHFRGRVLLADEVGLGKTIEAGMILKEYLLRGLVEHFLILTPASLVGQWEEEMRSKFNIDVVTTYDPLLKDDPESFWAGKRIIASIATARRDEHLGILLKRNFDIVIVDESHHLKNRATKNWKLVNSLKKKFILLLSATPVQNNLIELYNILTLLKPGIFKTEKDFRSAYMERGDQRKPLNKTSLQQLMKDVMIRNTRALVDVHLPPRRVLTIRIQPKADEEICYQRLHGLILKRKAELSQTERFAINHLLAQAGSSPFAITKGLSAFIQKRKLDQQWKELYDLYSKLQETSKAQKLLELLNKNPKEKKIIFVRYRETIDYIARLLESKSFVFAGFDGSMSGREKDQSIHDFRYRHPILLSTESGGEGRNLQFCNTIINYDLPWNPQVIEQRIGRIHRIGQEREVFIFNLTCTNTLEDEMLRILDEKINMFELVVGEIQSILGEIEQEGDFSNLVFSAWIQSTQEEREIAFNDIGEKMLRAKSRYEQSKQLDEDLFGEEFVAL